MTTTPHAYWAGSSAPTSETAHVASAGRIGIQNNGPADFRGKGFADQAAQVIDGEAQARAYLDRLRADLAQPGELAALLTFLQAETLHGACRLIEKALRRVRHV